MTKDQWVAAGLQTPLTRQKGMHFVKKKLANGTVRTYAYWRDGGRIAPPGPLRLRLDPEGEKRAITALLHRTRIRARLRGLPMRLDRAAVQEKLHAQSYRCAVTGLEFSYKHNENKQYASNPYGLSLDRLDNALGYTADNTQLVLVAINIALNEWGLDTFLTIARAAVSKSITS